jgi:hypothetical protein
MRKPVDQQPSPGSPEAIAPGCTCSPIANHGGRGRFRAPFSRVYTPTGSVRSTAWPRRWPRFRPAGPTSSATSRSTPQSAATVEGNVAARAPVAPHTRRRGSGDLVQ